MKFDSTGIRKPPATPVDAGAPTDGVPRTFWGAIAFGMTLWVLRRGLFILAAGALGALVSVILDGGSAFNGAVIGMVTGFGLLIAWFVVSEVL
jgi:hypothetical protein